jgi:hypothetical protein
MRSIKTKMPEWLFKLASKGPGRVKNQTLNALDSPVGPSDRVDPIHHNGSIPN